MDVLDCYPKSKIRFFSWTIDKYGIEEKRFDQAPVEEQCREIARFIGYPIVFPSEWTILQLERKIHDYLYLYEINLITYPYDVPDSMKILDNMDYIERDKLYDEECKREQEAILPGLNAALIKRIGYQDTDIKKETSPETNNTKEENYEDCPF